MQKFQVGLIAMLICCVAFVSCMQDRDPMPNPMQEIIGSVGPTGEPEPVVTDPAMIEPPTNPDPSKMPGGESDVTESMVRIPAGEFQMGDNDAEGRENAKPVHTVYVDAFDIDTHEVTNAEYRKFVLANPRWQKAQFGDPFYLLDWNGNDYPSGKGNHPVTNVSWRAAMAYATSAGKRLPTEAEWEKAARGGLNGAKYPWGDRIASWHANYDNALGTKAVGSYEPNGFGLYDVTGNVSEWCLDAYEENFYKRSQRRNPIAGGLIASLVNDFLNSSLTVQRVTRGGSWKHLESSMNVARRRSSIASNLSDGIGFRCVKPVTP